MPFDVALFTELRPLIVSPWALDILDVLDIIDAFLNSAPFMLLPLILPDAPMLFALKPVIFPMETFLMPASLADRF